MPTLSAALRSSPGPDKARPARPFLKWAGGKGQLLEQLEPLLPRRVARYHEPFLGGAALFFHLRARSPCPTAAALTDVNAELTNCYLVVRDRVDDLIAALGRHTYERDHYYAIRDQGPASLSPVEQAARTIFLNRTGFNGLYRVNSEGRFNVPFGRHTSPKICDEANLRACADALRGAEVEARDFACVAEIAVSGDFVYFDPPYSPLSSTANFTSYSAGGFLWEDQVRLADVFRALDRKRVRVMLSNSDVPEIRELYRGYRIDLVSAARSINSRADGRGKVGEVVIRNFCAPVSLR
jgi:DNA adenine methylase